MNINIKIDAEGLEGAILTLAQVLAGMDLPQTVPNVEVVKADEIVEGTVKAVEAKAEVKADKPEPKKESKPSVTLETVRTKLAELAQAGKQAQVKELIKSFGAQKLSDVAVEDYAELLEKASAV